jgi:type II secretion system protein N
MIISERLRRLGKVAAILWFGLFVFAVVFYLSLPYGRFKDTLAGRLAAAGYDMEAKHAGPSLGLGMSLEDVTLVSQSTGAAKPTRILIEKVTLGWSVLSSLFGTKSYSLSADVFKGEIDAKVKVGKNDSSAKVSATEIDLAEVPWVKSAINLPISGKLEVNFAITLPKQRSSEAKGSLGWSCSACALGDGKAKLVIASNPLLAEGLGLPKIRLGDFTGKVVIDKGIGRLQGVSFKSQDLDATVEGEIHLAQPIGTSHVDLYVRFKLSDNLLRSSEKLRTIMDLTAQLGKRPDGFLGFRAMGTFANMGNVQWLKTSPFLSAPAPAPAKPTPPGRPVPVPPPAALPALPVAPAPPPPAATPPPPPPPPPPPQELPPPAATPPPAPVPPPPAPPPVPAPPVAMPSTAPAPTPTSAPVAAPPPAPAAAPAPGAPAPAGPAHPGTSPAAVPAAPPAGTAPAPATGENQPS